MKKGLRLFVCILILVCHANPAFAAFAGTEYYVDFENGTDGARTCTDDNPASDECKTLQYALDTVTAQTDGSRINVEWDSAAMTQTLTASIDVDTNAGASDTPIITQGYSSTPGDGTQAIIDADSTAANCINASGATASHHIFKDLELKGSTGNALVLNRTLIFAEKIKVSSGGADGISFGSNSNGQCRVVNCEITGTTSDGIAGGDPNNSRFCYIHDVTGPGMTLNGGSAIGNLIDTTAQGLIISSDLVELTGNTIYNSTGANNDNIVSDSANNEYSILINNICKLSADESLHLTPGARILLYYHNAIETKVVQAGEILFELNESTADPQFEDAGGANFNIGANLDNLGFSAQNLNTASTETNEMGVYPYEEAGGAGGGGRGACWSIQ